VTYAILLTHFSRGCDWDQVDTLLQEMHAKGMAARTAIYTALIRQLCRTNQWNKALGLYLVMRDLGADITPAMYTDLLQVGLRLWVAFNEVTSLCHDSTQASSCLAVTLSVAESCFV